MGYVTEGLADAVTAWFDEQVKSQANDPSPGFLEELDADGREALSAVLAMVRDGTFPVLWDFHPALGEDVSGFPNIDDGVYALANDGAGNYWVLYPDGGVDSWCHDEGGGMEGNEFDSLDSLVECIVLTSAVKGEAIAWSEVEARFAERAEDESGWEFFHEDVEEFVEDL